MIIGVPHLCWKQYDVHVEAMIQMLLIDQLLVYVIVALSDG